MRYFKILSIIIMIAVFAKSNAQSYSQPAYIISSGAEISNNDSYSNFGVLGEAFDNNSVTGNSYRSKKGILVGIKKDLSVMNGKIYPNPTNQFLNIEFSTEPKKYNLAFYNNLGQLIIQKESSNKLEQIDLMGTTSGIYILKVYNNNFSKTEKIIVK